MYKVNLYKNFFYIILQSHPPDAALYWLAKMVYAGEDPRFIFRRLLILASEDVGLAEPHAIVVVNSCAEAFDRVGMPEGRYHLAQATLYLATAAKSNSTMGFFDALAAVEREHTAEVPNHLKDSNRDKQGFGHGAGYLYPHVYRDHWVEQQYLPADLQGQVFYQPITQGFEAKISTLVAQRREAQLEAIVANPLSTPVEVLTYGKSDRTTERWLQRTLSQVGEQLAVVRERIFALAHIQRHHLILDLNAGSGLLSWEAIRHAPEGGVYACVGSQKEADAIKQQAIGLPELLRPTVIVASVTDNLAALALTVPSVKFDRIIGRSVLVREADKAAAAFCLAKLLQPKGVLVLAETIPRYSQRLYRLLDASKLDADLYQRLVVAEEKIYADTSDPMVNWDIEQLRAAFLKAGLQAEVTTEHSSTQMYITPALLERWFTTNITGRPSYAQRLAAHLTLAEVETVREQFQSSLLNQTVNWSSAIAFVQATAQPKS